MPGFEPRANATIALAARHSRPDLIQSNFYPQNLVTLLFSFHLDHCLKKENLLTGKQMTDAAGFQEEDMEEFEESEQLGILDFLDRLEEVVKTFQPE